ncbi:Dehydrogenase/reductase (SDR family) member 13a, duplicate 3 [Balamuthia mandrillaris]
MEGQGSCCSSNYRDGQERERPICIVTGANTGIGKETALGMAAAGFHVILACRSIERGQAATQDIRQTLLSRNETQHRQQQGHEEGEEPSLEVMELDLSDLSSVRRFVRLFRKAHPKLHVLVNNAAVVTATRKENNAGLELMFATNHLGPFLLTNLLLPSLQAASSASDAPPARIIVVSSAAHAFCGPLTEDDEEKLLHAPHFTGTAASVDVYGRSKLCNVLFTVELHRRLQQLQDGGANIIVNAVHPGPVNTDLVREGPRFLAWLYRSVSALFFKTPAQGARGSLHCALNRQLGEQKVSGKYFGDDREAAPKPFSQDREAAAMLWQWSERLAGWKWEERDTYDYDEEEETDEAMERSAEKEEQEEQKRNA